MSSNEKYITDIMQGFQNNKGKGSCYCIKPFKPAELISKCVEAYNNKHPDDIILIVVDDFNTRKLILDNINNIDKEHKFRYNILSKSYINTDKYHYNYKYTIICGLEKEDIKTIIKLTNESNFTLCIFTKIFNNNELLINLRQLLPNITSNVKNTDIQLENVYSPVKEYHIGVDLTEDDRTQYDKCTTFINESIKIFGNLYNIEKCKKGDIKLNISANEFRNNLAIENGWNPNLDVSIPYEKQIDEIYNPNTLFERACIFYNITTERRNILTDNKVKLEKIFKICKENENKRILIVSKRGEFASKITQYLEKCNIKCTEYHDNIEDAQLVDDFGNPILHKSGASKGKPRIIKAQAISTRNLNEFNFGHYNVLSIKFSSNEKIETNVDIVIITDGINDDITFIKSRFANIQFNENPTIVYRLYTNNTVEADKLNEYIPNNNITIYEDKKELIFDEKSGNIIL